ncbi:hypothetical protein RUM43_006131 [Polyplax serrata]|uniref:Pre-mRNA cleavage complex 2 protein Pcf11 n=1 Tax=Polyplax serrata TaxID=468196 RepID=A0AAN8NRG4_POLSC
MSKEVAEEYLSSLADLTVNSKPLINMLTMLADENVDHAPAIVQVIENHLEKVPPEVKLPILYLIDSIIKNVSKVYVPLFTQNIVNVFVSVFEKVDERTRLNMYKLRQTWADVFPARKLYVLDLRVKDIDHAWPVTAPTPTSIHFNPKFLGNKTTATESSSAATAPQNSTPATGTTTTSTTELPESVLREQLLKKQQILIELQQKKLELQLMQTKAIIEGQENQLGDGNGQVLLGNLVRPPLNEETAKLFSQRAGVKPMAVVMPPSSSTKFNTSNSVQNKTKIAPANVQLIKAAKSRDPRLARQQRQQQNKASTEVSHKEQEIYNRQLAMLKAPLLEQATPVVPAQKVLGDSNVKGHITFNVQGHPEKDRLNAKNKKQIKESMINDNSKNKSKPVSSKEFKGSPTKVSKTVTSKSSRNLSSRERRNLSSRAKTPPKNERSASPGNHRSDSPAKDARWSKDSHRHSRSHSTKSSSKVGSNKSSNSPSKVEQDSLEVYSPKDSNSPDGSDISKKSHRKSKKKHKRGDNYYEKETGTQSKEAEENSPGKKKLRTRSDVSTPVTIDLRDLDDTSSVLPGFQCENQEVTKRETERTDISGCTLKSKGNSDYKKDEKLEKHKVKHREKSETFLDENQKPDKLAPLDLELIESSPSPEPPPPPIISRSEDDCLNEKKDEIDFDEGSEDEKESRNEVTGFKDMKGVSKGRNYIRRNRELSTSPTKEITGDVDFRNVGPPEKQARLLLEEDKSNVIEKSLVNVSGKDVDLRLLTIRGGSPNKKRLSTETKVEEPPKKKNKSEIFDELFGTEDVDLRKITRGTLSSADGLPSPPPPPVISNGPAVPQVAAIAPLVIGDSSKPLIRDATNELGESDVRERDGFDRGRFNRRTWTDLKLKPEAEIKPLKLPTQLELEIDSRKDNSFPAFDSSEKGSKKHFKDRSSPRGELDRLGRPLLYNKLPNDPRARRESLGVLDGRDTDLRRLEGLMDRDYDTNINVNMIIAQAGDQVRNGTMTLQEYNELLKQVIHVNEKQKLREAQNKSRQEIRKSQHHHRNRRSPNRFGPQNRKSPPVRHDDERRDRRPFNDIDERLPMPWRNMNQHNESSGGFNRLPYGVKRTAFDVPEYNDRQVKPEIWEEDSKCLRNVDDFDKTENRIRDVMCNERTHDCVDVPPADPEVLEMIAKDPMKSINIDGTARDIRFFGDTAIVMLSWDDPKEISFEDGIRRVAIGDLNITCALNDPCIMFMLNGNPHRIRLGAPTRELYIDDEFYEAHFGGPPVQVNIDGLPYLVQLEGPPPQVKIGKKRMDLICGRVNMIVDATAMLPLYLDAKPQRFDLKSRPYVFRIVNNLKTLLVNEVPVDIQFGGGCRQICGYGNLHFLRLSVLPNGVEPGRVRIVNMENNSLTSLSSVGSGKSSPPVANAQLPSVSIEPNLANSGVEVGQQQPSAKTMGAPLDILTSLMSGVSAPEQSVGFNYQVESQDKQVTCASVRQETEPTTSQTQASTIPFLGSGININDLFQRLVASGIVPTLSGAVGNTQKSQPEVQVKPMDFSDTNALRERQPSYINTLYSGIQCSSCGVRFSPEETVKYSRHLDWHFRQNRREKDAARKGQSRKWYYDVSDWIQFEEIEDLEERAQSWFEAEATTNTEENNEQEEIKSVPAPSGQGITKCELCRDEFETYYNEEKEEWHLKPCIVVDAKYYHPLCYEDLSNLPEDSLLVDKTADDVIVKDDTLEENVEMLETVNIDEEKEEEEEVEKNIQESEKFEGEKESKISHEDLIPEVVEPSAENLELDIGVIDDEEKEPDEAVIKTLLKELVNCIVFKNEIDLSQELTKEVEEEEEKMIGENDQEEEIEVLESVPVEAKKNIIDVVNLVEKMDDEDEIVYQRKTPSPIVLIPPAKIKQEPVDEMESPLAVVDQTYTNVVSSIDGNVEMIDTPQIAQPAPSRIKITFNKPITMDQNAGKQVGKETSVTPVDEDDPDPLPLKPKKPRIAEREMTVYLPCVRGTEVSGLCSIM